MLNEKVDILTLSPIHRNRYESWMKLKNGIAAISESKFNAGRQEGKLETTRILKQLGGSTQKIVQATDFTPAEVEAIR